MENCCIRWYYFPRYIGYSFPNLQKHTRKTNANHFYMKKLSNSLLNYEAPECFEFQNAPASVLCGSFTTPEIVEEEGQFEWV